jgi:hypothetical protein
VNQDRGWLNHEGQGEFTPVVGPGENPGIVVEGGFFNFLI